VNQYRSTSIEAIVNSLFPHPDCAVNMKKGFEPAKIKHELATLAAGRLYIPFYEATEPEWLAAVVGVVEEIEKQLRSLGFKPVSIPSAVGRASSVGETVSLPSAVGRASSVGESVVIVEATYGSSAKQADVTAIVAGAVKDGVLKFHVTSANLGFDAPSSDPAFGVRKKLKVRWNRGFGRDEERVSLWEGDTLVLGVFMSVIPFPGPGPKMSGSSLLTALVKLRISEISDVTPLRGSSSLSALQAGSLLACLTFEVRTVSSPWNQSLETAARAGSHSALLQLEPLKYIVGWQSTWRVPDGSIAHGPNHCGASEVTSFDIGPHERIVHMKIFTHRFYVAIVTTGIRFTIASALRESVRDVCVGVTDASPCAEPPHVAFATPVGMRVVGFAGVKGGILDAIGPLYCKDFSSGACSVIDPTASAERESPDSTSSPHDTSGNSAPAAPVQSSSAASTGLVADSVASLGAGGASSSHL
jgi:hypothetical protein